MLNFLNKNTNRDITIRDLFDARLYQPYVKNERNKYIKNFFWDCKDIQDSLNKIILECEKNDTPESRYFKALALAWSRIEYNDKAIEALEEYLEREPYNAYNNDNASKAFILGYLGKAYEKKYDYDTALKIYNEQVTLDTSQIPLISIAEIHRKKNDLDSAIKLMENAIKSNNKKIDKEVIKRYLEDYKLKKEKGYIFRNRNINHNN